MAITALSELKQSTFAVTQKTDSADDFLLPSTSGTFYLVPLRKPHDTCLTGEEWDEFKIACSIFCSKVTTPDYAITEDMSTYGFGGANKAKAMTTVEKTDQITTTWNEQSGDLVSKIIKNWVYNKKNPLTGLSTVIPYNGRNISCDFAVFFAKPTMVKDITTIDIATLKNEIITACYIYKHASPTNLPRSTISIGDREASSAVKFDTIWTFREIIDATVPCNGDMFDTALTELASAMSENPSALVSCVTP